MSPSCSSTVTVPRMIPFDGTMERLASESLSQLSRTVVQEMETVHEGAAGSVAGGSVGASVAGCGGTADG